MAGRYLTVFNTGRELSLTTARQLACLPDPIFARDTTVKAQIGLSLFDVGFRPCGDLIEMIDAMRIELGLVDTANSLNQRQIIGCTTTRRIQTTGKMFRCCDFSRRIDICKLSDS